MQLETRKMKPEEEEILRSRLSSPWKIFEAHVIKWVLLTLITLVPLLILEKWITSPGQIIYLCIQQIVLLPLIIRLNRNDPGIKLQGSLKQAIAEGEVEIMKVESERTIRRKSFKDFGSGYYFDTGDNRTLYLEGQHLDVLKGEGKFPCSEFEIIRSSHNGILIDLICRGSQIKPHRTVKAFTSENYRSGEFHSDGQIIECTMDRII
ncbi:MAG: hypothetical protein PQJ50_11375 [Spirochaetales bacterium]|nr:hypothetical protein [Spirochaetales bacterium]